MTPKLNKILLFFCFFRYYTQSSPVYEDLGASINRQIQESLRPLQNLGSRITQDVNRGLEPVRQLPSRLDHLGETIQQQVYEGLRPVRELESRIRIKYGSEGTTIASYKDKTFIVRNGILYECDGQISEETGNCSGSLKQVTFDNNKDFCYANVNAIINNWYCLGNGNIQTGFINGKVFCSSNDGGKTLLITEQEYKKLCGNVANPVTYKYFTNKPLGDYDSGVRCTGTSPIICTMTENGQGIASTVIQSSGGSYINLNK